VEGLRGAGRPPKDVESQLWDQDELSRDSGGAGAIVVGPGGESSVEKCVMETDKCCGPTFNLDDCDHRAAQASSRSKLLLLNPSPKATHRPLVSTILLSGARTVIEKQEVRRVDSEIH